MRLKQSPNQRLPHGITLMETLVGVGVFAVIAVGLYSTYTGATRLSKASRVKSASAAVANQYMEIARNLPYGSIGVQSGIPSGVLPLTQNAVRDGITFSVRYTVRNVDDPFDGTIGGNPNDTSPADYKQVTVEVTCTTCPVTTPVSRLTSQLGPKNLETATNNGALFIQVIDASGQPVQNASVSITNSTLVPAVNINDTTNSSGVLQLVDVPPASESYRIVVTKTGYSTERTYPPDDAVVINPVKLDATVIVQQVTQITFAIDLVSTINVASITSTCAAVPNVDFSLTGAKLISIAPDVYKYQQNLVTDGNGLLTLTNMEWDSYTPVVTDSGYDLTGTIPLVPFNLAPNTTQDLKFVLANSNPHSFLVVVRDAGTGLPLEGASVHLTKPGYDNTLLTSRGYFRQTSWKDGAGQASFVNPEMYFSDDGNVEINNPVGELKLDRQGNTYFTPGSLISSTFDAGTATNFTTIEWQPGSQPPETGFNSLRFQLATNNDNTTWDFLGPDGTAATYYETSGQPITAAHNGTRYLRYQTFLGTSDTDYTPNLADIAVTFTSSCIPPGQAFFTGLTSATYDLEVSLTGYQTSTTPVDLSPNWTTTTVNLLPE